jgi:hypothetical protein
VALDPAVVFLGNAAFGYADADFPVVHSTSRARPCAPCTGLIDRSANLMSPNL